jgi:hypothetical protein
MPQTHALCRQGRVRHFEHDAAHILFGEEIFPGELEVVEGAERVEEKGIAAPAREESVIPCPRYTRISPRRDWRSFKYDLPLSAHPRSLCAFYSA